MSLLQKYKKFKERLRAEREAFESSLFSSTNNNVNVNEEAVVNKAANSITSVPEAASSQQTQQKKAASTPRAQNDMNARTVPQVIPPSPNFAAKKAPMMMNSNTINTKTAGFTGQGYHLPPGAVLMKGPPPSGAKIMMHNPSAPTSRPLSPRVQSANSSQTIQNNSAASVPSPPYLGVKRPVSPPMVHNAQLNNSFVRRNSITTAAPGSPPRAISPSLQQQQQQQSVMQMNKPAMESMHASPSTPQKMLHPPQPQMVGKIPQSPALHAANTQKVVMGVANMRGNVIQPANLQGPRKTMLQPPQLPANNKIIMKTPMSATLSPRASSGVTQSQVQVGGSSSSNNVQLGKPTPVAAPSPPLLSSSLSNIPAAMRAANASFVMSRNASFAGHQLISGGNANTPQGGAALQKSATSPTPPLLPSHLTQQQQQQTQTQTQLNNYNNTTSNAQQTLSKSVQNVNIHTTHAIQNIERNASTPVFMENDEMSEIQFQVESTPQAASTHSDIRSERQDDINFEVVEIEEEPTKRPDSNNDKMTKIATPTTATISSANRGVNKESNTKKDSKDNSATAHSQSDSESSAILLEETIAPRKDNDDGSDRIKKYLETKNGELHSVNNVNSEIEDVKPLSNLHKHSPGKRKISVRRRRRRRHPRSDDEGEEENKKMHIEKNANMKQRDADNSTVEQKLHREPHKHHHHEHNKQRKASYRSRHGRPHSNVSTSLQKEQKEEEEEEEEQEDRRKHSSRKFITNKRKESSLSSSLSSPSSLSTTSSNRPSRSSKKHEKASVAEKKQNSHRHRRNENKQLRKADSRKKATSHKEIDNYNESSTTSSSSNNTYENDSNGSNLIDGRASATKTMVTLEPHFNISELTHSNLTTSSRTRIAEQFLSILCPQQYYGIVKKIHGIRPIQASKHQKMETRHGSSILVATKGLTPNRYFYPQLRLDDNDIDEGAAVNGNANSDNEEAKNNGVIDTPIILYEAVPGTMLFANNELDAVRLLQSESAAATEKQQHHVIDSNVTSANNANKSQSEKQKELMQEHQQRIRVRLNSTTGEPTSCFVLSKSAILFSQPERSVIPIAQLVVRWVPYASPSSEPQCAIHKKEMELFAPDTKELVCALCAHKSGIHTEHLIVIPDVIKTSSRRRLSELIQRQLNKAMRVNSGFVNQHQRLVKLKHNQIEAIDQQFDLLKAALESKRKEFYETTEMEYKYVMSEVARNILSNNEQVQLLNAAEVHLHGDITKPLYSMQIATIAEGLEVMQASSLQSKHKNKQLEEEEEEYKQIEEEEEYFYNGNNRKANRLTVAPLSKNDSTYHLELPSMADLTPNLEKVMSELQAVTTTTTSVLPVQNRTQSQHKPFHVSTSRRVRHTEHNDEAASFTLTKPTSMSSVTASLTYPYPRSRSAQHYRPRRRQEESQYYRYAGPSTTLSPFAPRRGYAKPQEEEECWQEEEEQQQKREYLEWLQNHNSNNINGSNNINSYRSRTAPLRRSIASPIKPRRVNFNNIDYNSRNRYERDYDNRVGFSNSNNNNNSIINCDRRIVERALLSQNDKRNSSNKYPFNMRNSNGTMPKGKAFRTVDEAIASYTQQESTLRSPSRRLSSNKEKEQEEEECNEKGQRLLPFTLSNRSEQEWEQYREEEERYENGNYQKMLNHPRVVTKIDTNQDKVNRYSNEQTPYDALGVPNSSDTFLFNFPIHELLEQNMMTTTTNTAIDNNNNNNNNNSYSSISKNGVISSFTAGPQGQRKRFISQRVVRWQIRIDDAGDWVGIGVGVGCSLSHWVRSKQNDFSHLWIVPQSNNPQTFVLEVRVRSGVGHAKLIVYNLHGKQLDEGNIPQWNVSRPCYPQATFGGRIGVVRITEPPHIV